MVHGDENGLRMPPRVAPIQAVIVPIWRKDERARGGGGAGRARWSRSLTAAGIRVKADWREERPGFKYNDWELRGVPVRIEIGPRDAANGQVVLVPRTNRAGEGDDEQRCRGPADAGAASRRSSSALYDRRWPSARAARTA